MNEENRGNDPVFFCYVGISFASCCRSVEIAVRVVSGVVQVLHVRLVITEAIRGDGTFGRRSAGGVVVVVHMVMVD